MSYTASLAMSLLFFALMRLHRARTIILTKAAIGHQWLLALLPGEPKVDNNELLARRSWFVLNTDIVFALSEDSLNDRPQMLDQP